jgi:hypothetical protein
VTIAAAAKVKEKNRRIGRGQMASFTVDSWFDAARNDLPGRRRDCFAISK